MHWSEIIGHKREIKMLRRAVENNHLPPAYMFTGPEGIGRRQVALALAKAIFCPERAGGDFCDSCSCCQRIDSGNFPETFFLAPAGGTIKIERIREIKRVLAYRSGSGSRRLTIIEGAEKLTLSAANSLLKILEEPPGGALFVLIAPGTAGIIPTVVSRCQRISFAPLEPGEIADFLIQKQGMDSAGAKAIAASAQGSMGRALQVSPESRRRFRELAGKVLRSENSASGLTEESFSPDRAEMLEELEFLRGFFRDCLVEKLGREKGGGSLELINPDLEEMVREEEGRAWEDLFRRLDVLAAAIRAVQANANPHLIRDRFVLGMG